MSVAAKKLDDTCFVIGNGPSLRGFDFRRLSGAATLGMNAAYRYWREIDWYPTYYSCLDDELIATHWREIIGLVRDGRVKKAFVSGRLPEFDRSIIGDDRFVYLDQFIPYWFRQRGKDLDAPFIDSPYFKTSRGDKITTGSHSVRFAAHLGFRNICLLGIDLKYVEVIPEAEQVGDISLRIRETPQSNPNYFFDGYQQAGDRYNIPNPAEHSGDLHFASLKTVEEDFRKIPTAPRILNCNANSRLFEDRVFPYLHPDRMLNDRPLSAVVVPTTLKERDALLNQLWLFDQDNFAPAPSGDFLKPALTYVFNSGDSRSLEAEIADRFLKSPRLQEAFEKPEFINLGLSGEQDVYIRDYSQPAGRFGYKAGPNNQFFETLRLHARSAHYIFLMESDCLPIRPGWLRQLQNQLLHAEPFWILGSAYRGKSTLGESYKRHVNGNAIYAAGDATFQHFIDTFWRPELERVIQTNPRIAYDCALEIIMNEAVSEDPDNPTWRLMQELLHRIRCTDMIHNRSGLRDSWDTPPDLPAQLYREDPFAYFLHGKPFADAVAAMRKAGVADIRDFRPPRGQPPAPEGSTQPRPPIVHSEEFPRILVLDHTLIGDSSATGELKASLFQDWPKSQYAQICGGNANTITFSRVAGKTPVDVNRPDQVAWLKTKIDEFKPELIVYRPVPDTQALHDFAMNVIHCCDTPLVTWIMDDWPKSLERRDKAQFERLDADLRKLFVQSAGVLSIGEAMSRAFGARYGVTLQPFANGIDPKHWAQLPQKSSEGGLVVRYSGSLSPSMGLESIVQTAQAVERLAQGGVAIRFEIKTRQHWLDGAGGRFAAFRHTKIITQDFTAEDYHAWLAGADIVLIAYNFDEASLDYVRYSMANKLPECLASGAVLLAIGPSEVATIALLKPLDCAVIVSTPGADAILDAVRGIVESPERRSELTDRSKELAFGRFDIRTIRRDFQGWLRRTLRTSHLDLDLKITRNAERRRWAHRHTDRKPATAAPSKLSASFDPSGFIRPVQVIANVAAPATPPSSSEAPMNVAAIAEARPAPQPARGSPSALTIFPIFSAQGSAFSPNGGSSALPANSTAPSIEAPQMPRADFDLPPTNAPRPAVNPAPVATPAASPSATPAPVHSHGADVSIRQRLFGSRTAKATSALGAAIVLAAVAVIVLPASPDLRFAWGIVIALGILAAAGAYFAHRTLSFARRTASENADTQAKLGAALRRLGALEHELRASASQQNTTMNSVAQRIERQLVASTAGFEQRFAALATLEAEQRQTKASVQALSARGDNAAAEIGALKESIAESLGELRQHQSAEAARFTDSVDIVSGRLSELTTRVDTETARIDDLRLDVSQARGAFDALDALAREGLADASDRLSALRETAFLDAENRRQMEERVALLEDAADKAASSMSKAFETARSAAEEAKAEARLATADISRRVASMDDAVREFPRLAERISAVDDFAKQVANEFRILDDQLKEGLKAADGERQTLGDVLSMLRAGHADVASQLPLLAERVAIVDDFAKQVANNVAIADEDVRHALKLEAERRGELVSAMSALSAELAASHAASLAADGRIREVESHIPLLAERLAFTDDLAKSLYCDAQIADENVRKAISDSNNLSSRITSVNEGVGRLANSHAEVRMIVSSLQQSSAADHKLLSELGPQLAEIAGLSEQFVAETTTVLRGLEAKVASSEMRLASNLAPLSARVDGIDEKINVSATRLEGGIAQMVEQLGAKADRKALDDLALRLAELAELSESAAGQTGRELGAVASHVTSLAAESAALRDRISMLAVSLAEKADAAGLGALERRAVEGAVAQVAERLAGFGRQVAAVEAQVLSVEQGLAGARAHFDELRQGVESARSVAAQETGTVAAKLEKLEAGLTLRLSEMAVEAERRIEQGSRESEKARAALGGEMAAVGARVSELEGAVSRHVSEMGGAIREIAEESGRSRDGFSDKLAGVAKQLDEIDGALARQAAELATAIAGIQRELVDAVDSIQVETKESGDFRIATGKQIADLIQRLQAADAKGIAAIEEIRANLEDASKLQEQVRDLDGRLANETKQRFAYTTKSMSIQEEVGSKLTEVERAIADLAETTAKATGLTDSHIQSVSGKLAIVERGLADLAKTAGQIKGLEDAAKVEREKVAEISVRVNEAKQRIETTERTSMFDNASWYQRFNRRLQQQHIQVLEKEWTRKLSVQGSKATFGYMAARVSEIERELDGRLATTVEDVILRTLVAQATRGASVSVLEIGTLFGIGAAVMFDTLKNHFDDVHFTLLDPLEGYYAGGRPDILTGQPVTEKVVRRNMARAGMRDDQLRLITRLSTEEAAIAEASERLYDVLIIDADHSYAGVKTDFENFGRMVKLGGYVIFDDYGSEDWPDVKAYVDAEIPSADFLAHVGNSWRTSVYRVVKPPAAPRRVRPRSEQKSRSGLRKSVETTRGE